MTGYVEINTGKTYGKRKCDQTCPNKINAIYDLAFHTLYHTINLKVNKVGAANGILSRKNTDTEGAVSVEYMGKA